MLFYGQPDATYTATPARAIGRSRLAIAVLALIFGFALMARLWALEADPPAWMQGAFISDEGWWADSARGKVLFGDYYADDFGTAYLITPAYTLALEGLYKLFGVGTVQTRLVAAFFSTLSILAVGAVLWRTAGRRAAVIGAGLLALSPFFWVYGRTGLQEPMQGFFVAAGFALFMIAQTNVRAEARAPNNLQSAIRNPKFYFAFLSGVSLAVAIAVKPNSISLGLVPVGLGLWAAFFVEHANLDSRARPRMLRSWLGLAMLAGAGLTAASAAIFYWHVLPNWRPIMDMAAAESGSSEVTWRLRLSLPGMFLISTRISGGINGPIFWNPAHWSPALVAIFWFFVLYLMLHLRGGWRALAAAINPLEAGALCWALATLAVVGSSYYQPDRRYIAMFPALAILAGSFLARLTRGCKIARPENPRRGGLIFSFFLWLVLALPLMLLLKPAATEWIMRLCANVPLGRDAGLDYTAAGTVFMGLWAGGLMLLAPARGLGERLHEILLRKRVILVLVAGFTIAEAGVIGGRMACQESTMAARQHELAPLLARGETVMGHVATTLLMPLPLRTVRRVSQYEFAPPPNPDVWDRHRPRYLLEMTASNFARCQTLYTDLIAKGGYRLIRDFDIGPYQNGTARYQFKLYESPGGR